MSARATLAMLAVAAALGASALVGANAAVRDDASALLPAGPGRELVVQSCTICHSAALIAQQRLSEKAWTAELVKMERWGAPLDESQNAMVAAYLFAHFNPDVPEAPQKLVPSPKQPG